MSCERFNHPRSSALGESARSDAALLILGGQFRG